MSAPVAVKKSSILALDLVLGLAALVVVLGHAKVGAWVDYRSLPPEQRTVAVAALFGFARMGREAVLVFFVLSGFLVGGRLIDRVSRNNFSASAYVIDRTTRILIPLIPACMFTIAVNWMVFGQPIDALQLIGNSLGLNGVLVTTLDNNVPLWSLAYEIWFYVLGGAVAWLLSRGPNPIALICIAIGTIVFAKLSSVYLLFWTLGALTTRFVRMPWIKVSAASGLVLLFCGVVFYQSELNGSDVSQLRSVPPAVAEALVCLGFSFCLPALCKTSINERLEFMGRPIRFMSGISFSLYLVHFPVVAVLRTLFPQSAVINVPSVGVLTLYMGLSIMVATLFWLVFERNTGAVRAFLLSSTSRRLRPA